MIVEREFVTDPLRGDDLGARGLRQILDGMELSVRFEDAHELATEVNWKGAFSRPIHRWFKYREGFSPNLINSLNLGQTILDPFAGSGSIMVGAAEASREAVGIDVNPLAVFVARVKISPLSASQLARARAFLGTASSSKLQVDSWPAPGLEIADKVFEPEILKSLLELRGGIEALADDAALRDFLLLAWLSILQPVGNYFKEGNGIKYRNRKRIASGYVSRTEGEWQQERFGSDQVSFVRSAFAAQLGQMISDASNWETGTWSQQVAMEGTALDVAASIGGRQFDSVVFSPPYANRFDYFESLKVELWFGGFVSSYAELGSLRKSSLRSHLGADLSLPARPTQGLERLIELMDPSASSWRMGVPDALRGYFHDMWLTLRSVRGALKPGGKCHIVVGNSAYAGVVIPTDVLLAGLGLEAGFDRVKVRRVRHLTVAPQQRSLLKGLETYMRESVVTLE